MSFIKLTSFNKFTNSPEDIVASERIREDILINPDHVVRVVTSTKGIGLENGLTYKPTILELVGNRLQEVAESFEAVHHFLEGRGHRGSPRYIWGERTDDYGNPIESEATATG